MPNTKDEGASAYPSLLLVGESGTHKTYFIGTCPKPMLFDFDKTKRVLAGKDVEFATFRDAPYGSKVVNPEKGIYKFGDAYPRFHDHLNKVGMMMEKGDCPYETLAIDSLTFLGNIVLNHVLVHNGANNAQAVLNNANSIDQGLWGQQMRVLETIFDQLTAWDIIKVVTAHVQKDVNTVIDSVEKLPYVTGKLAGKIGGYFDEVWYTTTEGVGAAQQFVLRTNKDKILAQAKSPSGVPDKSPTEWASVAPYLFGTAPKGKPALVK
jgi:hypothetical protein